LLLHKAEDDAPWPETEMPFVYTRSRKDLNHLFRFERSPLGQRIPVILVPGRAQEYQQNTWWQSVRKLTQNDAAFNKKFKLYIYMYNSFHLLSRQASGLQNELLAYFGQLSPRQPVILITYSLGGIISREVMACPDVRQRVHTMFAIAVPFHGSPIFDPEWFSRYLSSRSPIRRLEDRALYRYYLLDKTNLIQGMRWNNFDQSKPQFSPQQAWPVATNLRAALPVATPRPKNSLPKPDQVDTTDAIVPGGEGTMDPDPETTRAIKEKTVVYASYIQNRYTQRRRFSGKPESDLRELPFLLGKTAFKLPNTLVSSVLPVYGLSVHSVFRFVNHQLSNLPTYTPRHPKGYNLHLYRFNDGVVPLSSALFLPPHPTPYDGDLERLMAATDVRLARVFPNLDHMHIGQYSSRRARIITADARHPEEGQRTPNDWLLYDLARLAEDIQP
jgi:hypothetical protein